jgi:hypothetical protein
LIKALEMLAPLEKTARMQANLDHSTKILLHIVDLCVLAGNHAVLLEQLMSVSKKRSQMKQVIIFYPVCILAYTPRLGNHKHGSKSS